MVKKEKTSINETSSPNSMSSTKAIIIFVVILVLGFFIYFLLLSKKENKPLGNVSTSISPTTSTKLPDSWRPIETLAPGVVERIEKKVKTGIQPTVILLTSTDQITDAKLYTNRLIEGAKSALPSLVIESNAERNNKGYYIKELKGYYYSGDQKVNIHQIMFVKGSHVYTLTGSYPDLSDNTSNEINTVFTYLQNKYIQ